MYSSPYYYTYFNTDYWVRNTYDYDTNYEYYWTNVAYYYELTFEVKGNKGKDGFLSGKDGKDRKYTILAAWDVDDTSITYNIQGAGPATEVSESGGIITKIYQDNGLTLKIEQSKSPVKGIPSAQFKRRISK